MECVLVEGLELTLALLFATPANHPAHVRVSRSLDPAKSKMRMSQRSLSHDRTPHASSETVAHAEAFRPPLGRHSGCTIEQSRRSSTPLRGSRERTSAACPPYGAAMPRPAWTSPPTTWALRSCAAVPRRAVARRRLSHATTPFMACRYDGAVRFRRTGLTRTGPRIRRAERADACAGALERRAAARI